MRQLLSSACFGWGSLDAIALTETPALFKNQANSEQRMSLKDTHLLGHIGNPQEIESRQQKTVEHSQNTKSFAFAILIGVFTASLTSRRQCKRFSMV